MPKQRLTVVNRLGFHARVAYRFAALAEGFSSDVFLEKDGTRKNGKDVMDILHLAAGQGDELLIYTEGNDAEEALARLTEFTETLTDDD